jgi:hypothetical protein
MLLTLLTKFVGSRVNSRALALKSTERSREFFRLHAEIVMIEGLVLSCLRHGRYDACLLRFPIEATLEAEFFESNCWLTGLSGLGCISIQTL